MVPPLSPEGAARVARACLEITIRRFVPAVPAPFTLFLDGDADPKLRELAAEHRMPVLAQSTGDLGQKLHAAFAALRSAGAEETVAIGSDSPTLDPERISEALDALRTHDAVLGPCEDGGYYLIGVRGELPGIVEDIPWSTADVTRRTLERAAALGASLHCLPAWYDVDDLPSLERAIADVDPRFRSLIEIPALST
jgi:rSAM/selenodomain-associated transferase 1